MCHSLIYHWLKNMQGAKLSKIAKLIRQHLLQTYKYLSISCMYPLAKSTLKVVFKWAPNGFGRQLVNSIHNKHPIIHFSGSFVEFFVLYVCLELFLKCYLMLLSQVISLSKEARLSVPVKALKVLMMMKKICFTMNVVKMRMIPYYQGIKSWLKCLKQVC